MHYVYVMVMLPKNIDCFNRFRLNDAGCHFYKISKFLNIIDLILHEWNLVRRPRRYLGESVLSSELPTARAQQRPVR